MDDNAITTSNSNIDIVASPVEKKKKRLLTLKYRKWLQFYINTGNAKKSALLAYNCNENSAGQIGYENLKKLDYPDFLEQIGVSDHLLGTSLLEGLKANSYDLIGKPHPNYNIRHKYLETGLKLKKRLSDNKDNPATNMIGLSINITPSGK